MTFVMAFFLITAFINLMYIKVENISYEGE